MARCAILSNGRLAVGLDEKGFVNDFYYPYVGLDNMTSARFVHHKLGIWVDGVFSWLDSSDWSSSACLDDHSMMARVNFHSDRYQLSISFRDFVDSTYDFFGRVVIVENHTDRVRSVRLFFSQVFQISDAGRVDTALYGPALHPYILTYHGNISFIAGLRTQSGESFDQFAVGNYGIEGKAGTYLDAEDGELSGNVVEHGGVDSIIRTSFEIHAKGSYHVDYWIAASDNHYSHATRIHRHLSVNGLYHYLNSTCVYWKNWLAISQPFIDSLDVKYQSLARKSILTIKAHCDEHGGVLASADSSIYNYGRDYYNYVWPRDAYYALTPLLRIGYSDEVKRFLEFITNVIHPRGYVHHKYLPNAAMGSTWHPLVQNGVAELNIQEDETAAVVLLAVEYINTTGDASSKFADKLYKTIIKPCANFMSGYMDQEIGLPHASYDLWEQVFLTNTYTVSIVYSALKSAKEYAESTDKLADAVEWGDAINSIEKNMYRLFDEKNQWYVRGLMTAHDNYRQASVLDIATLAGISAFGSGDIADTALFATEKAIETHNVYSGGVIRYQGDGYMLTSQKYSANPWYVATLWLGQHYLRKGDVNGASHALQWTMEHMTGSGLLSEQVDPDTGEFRGVSPLVWSHAEFLSTLILQESKKR